MVKYMLELTSQVPYPGILTLTRLSQMQNIDLVLCGKTLNLLNVFTALTSIHIIHNFWNFMFYLSSDTESINV